MSEMVERVARSLCVEDEHDPDKVNLYRPRTPGVTDETRNWMAYVDGARAAIAAMREPKMDLIWAAERAQPKGGIMLSGAEKRDFWNAMIDAALK